MGPSDDGNRNSPGAPTPAAPSLRASAAGADAPAEESAPAGEPEAPVAPPAEVEQPPADEPDNEPGEDEARVTQDLDELTARAQKADEYLDLAQRTKADFENYRKRAAKEAASAQERGVAKLAAALLPAVDNLDRALAAGEAASNGDEHLLSGIKLVHADVIGALARFGIEPFSPEGEPFDPTCHEAVAQQPSEDAQPGTVVEVYQRGYRQGESVLRPARVVVAG